MKVLHLTNHYPPLHQGNTELQCSQFVQTLSNQGHQQRVLTSEAPDNFKVNKTEEAQIKRVFRLYPSEGRLTFEQIRAIEIHNHQQLNENLANFRPEVILVWGAQNLSVSILHQVNRSGIPVVYGFFNRWADYWLRKDPWLDLWKSGNTLPKPFLTRLLLKLGMKSTVTANIPTDSPRQITFPHAFFCSQSLSGTMHSEGHHIGKSIIIPCALPLYQYPYRPPTDGSLRKLIYIDRINEGKDTMTAIKAIKELRAMGHTRYNLQIHGRADRRYEKTLHEYIRKSQVSGSVSLKPLVEDDIPALLRGGDIFLSTVKTPEAFPLMSVKAMAIGLPVLSTPSGSNKEIIKDGETGILFSAGKANELAEKIHSLGDDPARARKISEAARAQVEKSFEIKNVAARLHEFLLEVCAK